MGDLDRGVTIEGQVGDQPAHNPSSEGVMQRLTWWIWEKAETSLLLWMRTGMRTARRLLEATLSRGWDMLRSTGLIADEPDRKLVECASYLKQGAAVCQQLPGRWPCGLWNVSRVISPKQPTMWPERS